MTKCILGIGVVVAAVLAGTAATASAVPPTGSTTVICDPEPCQQPYQQWIAESRMPTPRLTFTLHQSGCPGRQEPACVSRNGPMYLDHQWLGPKVRYYFYHELGHYFDYVEMSEPARDHFRNRILRDPRPWRAAAPDSPHEKFAEAYAFCARFGTGSLRYHRRVVKPQLKGGGYGYWPYLRVHRRACGLIRFVARGS